VVETLRGAAGKLASGGGGNDCDGSDGNTIVGGIGKEEEGGIDSFVLEPGAAGSGALGGMLCRILVGGFGKEDEGGGIFAGGKIDFGGIPADIGGDGNLDCGGPVRPFGGETGRSGGAGRLDLGAGDKDIG